MHLVIHSNLIRRFLFLAVFDSEHLGNFWVTMVCSQEEGHVSLDVR